MTGIRSVRGWARTIMKTITATFPDGSTVTDEEGKPLITFVEQWKPGLSKSTVAVNVDGQAADVYTVLARDAHLEPIDITSKDGVDILRHSTSHIMAEAVQALFPGVKVTIGPAVEDGFYYDFDYTDTFTTDDLTKIEEKMKEIIAADQPFSREEMSRDEAVAFFEKMGETYKVELITDLPDDVECVSIYRQGNFVDLCRGPHIPSTGMISAFSLLNVAGAYWRGDERNKMLQRIYGTSFATKQDLSDYLTFMEEARKRDHRRLGRELDLFQINDEAGPGLAIFHPKGALLRTIIEDWERKEHLKRGYEIVVGPQILKGELWKKSGHFDHYRENMYFTEVEGQVYGIKPMNCLAHMLIYKSKIRSYRDLPIRYFELGTVLRHEKTGVLHGLMRVRQFTQDDAHILCTPEQLNDEIIAIADFVADAMAIFGFEYEVELSTRPDDSIGSDEDWNLATSALEGALQRRGIDYDINEGDGAFYGPKIDFKLKDALGRKWQCATIQCDFTLPERFDLTYVAADGERHRPVMLHRVILGAIERFMGVLIEHYAGALPLWLSPVQTVIMTVTDKQISYGEEVYESLRNVGVRVERDFRNEKLGYKIREAQMMKVPFMLVIGDKEIEAKAVAPRRRDGTNLGQMSVAEFVSLIGDTCRRFE